HPQLFAEPSSANWPSWYEARVAALFSGMATEDVWVTSLMNDEKRGRSMDAAREILLTATPEPVVISRLHAIAPSKKNAFAWLFASNAPTMMQLLKTLEVRSRTRANGRLRSKKRKQRTGAAADARFVRS